MSKIKVSSATSGGVHSKAKVFAPSIYGGSDRQVQVVYQRKAVYGKPSFLKSK